MHTQLAVQGSIADVYMHWHSALCSMNKQLLFTLHPHFHSRDQGRSLQNNFRGGRGCRHVVCLEPC